MSKNTVEDFLRAHGWKVTKAKNIRLGEEAFDLITQRSIQGPVDVEFSDRDVLVSEDHRDFSPGDIALIKTGTHPDDGRSVRHALYTEEGFWIDQFMVRWKTDLIEIIGTIATFADDITLDSIRTTGLTAVDNDGWSWTWDAAQQKFIVAKFDSDMTFYRSHLSSDETFVRWATKEETKKLKDWGYFECH